MQDFTKIFDDPNALAEEPDEDDRPTLPMIEMPPEWSQEPTDETSA